eukprot:scaffold2556_cov425-Prasinococcus_capsulatus_cf.AAC.11
MSAYILPLSPVKSKLRASGACTPQSRIIEPRCSGWIVCHCQGSLQPGASLPLLLQSRDVGVGSDCTSCVGLTVGLTLLVAGVVAGLARAGDVGGRREANIRIVITAVLSSCGRFASKPVAQQRSP